MARTLEARLAGALKDLIQWGTMMGGWNAPCWSHAEDLVHEFDTKAQQGHFAQTDVIIGQHPSRPESVVMLVDEHNYAFLKKDLLDAVETICKETT